MDIEVRPEVSHQCGMVDGVVVRTLCQWYQFNPVVLLGVAKGWEVLLHYLVPPLGLTVRLGVAGG
jgi:hypothetical protein